MRKRILLIILLGAVSFIVGLEVGFSIRRVHTVYSLKVPSTSIREGFRIKYRTRIVYKATPVQYITRIVYRTATKK